MTQVERNFTYKINLSKVVNISGILVLIISYLDNSTSKSKIYFDTEWVFYGRFQYLGQLSCIDFLYIYYLFIYTSIICVYLFYYFGKLHSLINKIQHGTRTIFFVFLLKMYLILLFFCPATNLPYVPAHGSQAPPSDWVECGSLGQTEDRAVQLSHGESGQDCPLWTGNTNYFRSIPRR